MSSMVAVVCVLVDFEVGGEGRGGFLLTGLVKCAPSSSELSCTVSFSPEAKEGGRGGVRVTILWKLLEAQGRKRITQGNRNLAGTREVMATTMRVVGFGLSCSTHALRMSGRHTFRFLLVLWWLTSGSPG